jgi:hypothetical protein
LNAIHEEFKARGLTVLLVNIREELDTVRRAVRDRHYMAPVVLDLDRSSSASCSHGSGGIR